jgi:hypothetical protein
MTIKIDPRKTAAVLEEVDVLKLQNIQLRQQLLNQEFQTLSTTIIAAYQGDDETISIGPDGRSIVRTKNSVPKDAVKKSA